MTGESHIYMMPKRLTSHDLRGVGTPPPFYFPEMIFIEKPNLQIFQKWFEVKFFEKIFASINVDTPKKPS